MSFWNKLGLVSLTDFEDIRQLVKAQYDQTNVWSDTASEERNKIFELLKTVGDVVGESAKDQLEHKQALLDALNLSKDDLKEYLERHDMIVTQQVEKNGTALAEQNKAIHEEVKDGNQALLAELGGQSKELEKAVMRVQEDLCSAMHTAIKELREDFGNFKNVAMQLADQDRAEHLASIEQDKAILEEIKNIQTTLSNVSNNQMDDIRESFDALKKTLDDRITAERKAATADLKENYEKQCDLIARNDANQDELLRMLIVNALRDDIQETISDTIFEA